MWQFHHCWSLDLDVWQAERCFLRPCICTTQQQFRLFDFWVKSTGVESPRHRNIYVMESGRSPLHLKQFIWNESERLLVTCSVTFCEASSWSHDVKMWTARWKGVSAPQLSEREHLAVRSRILYMCLWFLWLVTLLETCYAIINQLKMLFIKDFSCNTNCLATVKKNAKEKWEHGKPVPLTPHLYVYIHNYTHTLSHIGRTRRIKGELCHKYCNTAQCALESLERVGWSSPVIAEMHFSHVLNLFIQLIGLVSLCAVYLKYRGKIWKLHRQRTFLKSAPGGFSHLRRQ